jgi:tetratricopeptide (TPR) repeat protein
MKKLLIVLLVFITCNSYAQKTVTDSLKKLLHTEISDTTRVMLLTVLARHYWYSNPDTSIILVQQGMVLARQKGFVKGEARCLNSLGVIFLATGDYPKSLEYFLQTLKKYESIHDPVGIMKTIGNTASVYSEMGDFQMAMSLAMKCKTLAESAPSSIMMNYALLGVGDIFEKLNQLDSARIYTNRAYDLAIRLNNKEYQKTALINLGNIHSSMQQVEIAMGYYRLSLSMEKELKDFDGLCETTLGMSELFKKEGLADSALHYARLSLATANNLGFTKRKLNASIFLLAFYKGLNKIDSAYYYQGINIAAKDSLFSQEKTRAVQNLSFTEKIRQQEIEEAARLAKEERKSNVQLLGIGTFISFFFGLLFVFSKRKVNPKIVKFLGLLGLLLLFEFISLFIHPYIASWTHHIPVLMLLILVVVASILVPLHHKLEGWVKERLVQKSLQSSSDELIQLSEPIQENVKGEKPNNV